MVDKNHDLQNPPELEEALRLKRLAEEKYVAGKLKSALKCAKKASRRNPSLDGISEILTAFRIIRTANKNVGLIPADGTLLSISTSTPSPPDYYKILQVERFAPINTIKKQYKKLALTLHPDKNSFVASEEAFKHVGEAFRVLSDRIRRKEYDMRVRIAMQAEAAARVGSDIGELKTFWTACSTCRLLHKFERKYLGHNLVCPSCKKSFKAVEVGVGNDKEDENEKVEQDERLATRVSERIRARRVGKMSSVGEILKRSIRDGKAVRNISDDNGERSVEKDLEDESVIERLGSSGGDGAIEGLHPRSRRKEERSGGEELMTRARAKRARNMSEDNGMKHVEKDLEDESVNERLGSRGGDGAIEGLRPRSRRKEERSGGEELMTRARAKRVRNMSEDNGMKSVEKDLEDESVNERLGSSGGDGVIEGLDPRSRRKEERSGGEELMTRARAKRARNMGEGNGEKSVEKDLGDESLNERLGSSGGGVIHVLDPRSRRKEERSCGEELMTRARSMSEDNGMESVEKDLEDESVNERLESSGGDGVIEGLGPKSRRKEERSGGVELMTRARAKRAKVVEEDMMTLAQMQMLAKKSMKLRGKEKVNENEKEKKKGMDIVGEMEREMSEGEEMENDKFKEKEMEMDKEKENKKKDIDIGFVNEREKRQRRGVLRADFVEISGRVSSRIIKGSQVDKSKKSRQDNMDIVEVEELVFYDFDKGRSERSFKKGQVWATYDSEDGMPKHYALIDEVVSMNPFEVRLSWLEFQSNGDELVEKMGLNISCGRFKVSEKTSIRSRKIFSHIADFERVARQLYWIYPKKGSVWALYNENALNSEQSVLKDRYCYDIVVFLTSYCKIHGMSIAYLEKVDGFRTVFKRREIGAHAIRWLAKDDFRLFSHQIPGKKLSGEEASSLPKDCWVLDPSSLPPQPLTIGLGR